MPLAPELGPGDLEEADQARVVDRGDRRLAVLGRRDQLEARRPPRACARMSSARSATSLAGIGLAHERLDRDVVARGALGE